MRKRSFREDDHRTSSVVRVVESWPEAPPSAWSLRLWRSANAAGSLTIGLWDHWVPGANDVQSAIIKEWADREKVDVKVDYITSQGNKLLLTLAVEAQARSGHDIMEFTNWESAQYNQALEPVDDVVKNVVAKERADRSGGRVSRQVPGQMARRADDPRHLAARLLLALRHDEGVRRRRRAGALPGRQAAQRRELDLGRLPGRGREVPEGRHGFGLPLGNTTDTNQWSARCSSPTARS